LASRATEVALWTSTGSRAAGKEKEKAKGRTAKEKERTARARTKERTAKARAKERVTKEEEKERAKAREKGPRLVRATFATEWVTLLQTVVNV
jgi:hypothetical protein